MMDKTYFLALDLQNDEALIARYKELHRAENIWPEITASIRAAGVRSMEIYLVGNRLCMVMTVAEDFSWERKEELDRNNPRVREWEELMSRFQQILPGSEAGQKWRLMERIFDLSACP